MVGRHWWGWLCFLEEFEISSFSLPYAKLPEQFLYEPGQSGVGFRTWRSNWTRGGANGGKHRHQRHKDGEEECLGGEATVNPVKG